MPVIPSLPSVQESLSQRPPAFAHDAVSALEQMLHVESEAIRTFLERRHRNLLRALSSHVGEPRKAPRESVTSVDSVASSSAVAHYEISQAGTVQKSNQKRSSETLGESESIFQTESVRTAVRLGSQVQEQLLARIMKYRKTIKTSIRREYTADLFQGSRFAILRLCESIVRKDMFELVFGILIILNTCVMCFEAQYWGHDSAYLVMDVGAKEASAAWPGAGTFFRVVDMLFGVVFTFEVIMKVIGLRLEFVTSWWNLFDFVIIASWFAHTLVENTLPLSPSFLRLVRLARLIRLLRLAKTVQMFDTLHFMAASLAASASVLFWSVTILFGIMTSASLIMFNIIDMYIADSSVSLNSRREAYEYFGNFSRSLLSMFELTLGNWAPITRFLHEEVSGYFGIVIMVYYSLVSFAVVMVIRGVFLHETFQVAEENDELMIRKQRRLTSRMRSKMNALFCEADTDLSGSLSRNEFKTIMTDPRVNMWLAALGVEVRDVENMFDVIDDGNDCISAKEFINAFTQLKGPAKNVDMIQLLRLTRSLSDLVQDLGVALGMARKSDLLAHQGSLVLGESVQSAHAPETLLGQQTMMSSTECVSEMDQTLTNTTRPISTIVTSPIPKLLATPSIRRGSSLKSPRRTPRPRAASPMSPREYD